MWLLNWRERALPALTLTYAQAPSDWRSEQSRHFKHRAYATTYIQVHDARALKMHRHVSMCWMCVCVTHIFLRGKRYDDSLGYIFVSMMLDSSREVALETNWVVVLELCHSCGARNFWEKKNSPTLTNRIYLKGQILPHFLEKSHLHTLSRKVAQPPSHTAHTHLTHTQHLPSHTHSLLPQSVRSALFDLGGPAPINGRDIKPWKHARIFVYASGRFSFPKREVFLKKYVPKLTTRAWKLQSELRKLN